MSSNNFDQIARCYDSIVHLVFGAQLINATSRYFPEIDHSDQILIVGGGSGKLLHHLPARAMIDYLELSIQMIRLTKKQGISGINYIHSNIESYTIEKKYDVIILPFFLDLFPEKKIALLLNKLSENLQSKGRLYISDFAPPSRVIDKVLLKLMIIGLKPFVRLTIAQLADIQSLVPSSIFSIQKLSKWRHGFIFSAVYEKRETL